jgi:hypothetical protein
VDPLDVAIVELTKALDQEIFGEEVVYGFQGKFCPEVP